VAAQISPGQLTQGLRHQPRRRRKLRGPRDATWGSSAGTARVAPTDLWAPAAPMPSSLATPRHHGDPGHQGRPHPVRLRRHHPSARPPDRPSPDPRPPARTWPCRRRMNGGGETGISLDLADVSAAGVTSVAVFQRRPVTARRLRLRRLTNLLRRLDDGPHTQGRSRSGLPYDPNVYAWDQQVSLLHWNGTSWDNVTSTVDAANATVCGTVTSLSPSSSPSGDQGQS